MEDFAAKMLDDLHRYLVKRGAVDERWPECPDVEAKWPAIAEAYLPDGAREFANYPVASLGWMMFVAMAVTKFWDEDWEKYDKIEDLYLHLRDKRGYDNLDEYILDEVLDLHGDAAEQLQTLVGDCAERVKRALYHQDIERENNYITEKKYAEGKEVFPNELSIHGLRLRTSGRDKLGNICAVTWQSDTLL